MKQRRPKTGEVYRHFKGKRYRVMHIALCAETNEEMVVYEALQGEGRGVREHSRSLPQRDQQEKIS